MKTTHALKAAFMAGVLCLSACSQFKRLTGGDADDAENIGGHWGAMVKIDGYEQHFTFLLEQHDRDLGGIFYADASGLSGHVSGGQVSGKTFHMTLDEGTRCVNKYVATGEASNGTMVVTVTGKGNDIDGTTCDPRALNDTVALVR